MDMEINQVNCKNCGAPLHYDFTSKMAKCEYCDSEYHLNSSAENKQILNRTIELDIYGRRKFYISDVSCIPIMNCGFGRDISGQLKNNHTMKYKITLVSY